MQAQLQTRPPVTKDLSLVTMVPKWSGTDKAVPLHDFFFILESIARVGNWSQDDLIRKEAMKLTDVARVFYNGNLELHNKDVTWTALRMRSTNGSGMYEPTSFISNSYRWRNNEKINHRRNSRMDAGI